MWWKREPRTKESPMDMDGRSRHRALDMNKAFWIHLNSAIDNLRALGTNDMEIQRGNHRVLAGLQQENLARK